MIFRSAVAVIVSLASFAGLANISLKIVYEKKSEITSAASKLTPYLKYKFFFCFIAINSHSEFYLIIRLNIFICIYEIKKITAIVITNDNENGMLIYEKNDNKNLPNVICIKYTDKLILQQKSII